MPFKIHPISVNYIDMSEKTKDGTKKKRKEAMSARMLLELGRFHLLQLTLLYRL
jgi:hypothetical protein